MPVIKSETIGGKTYLLSDSLDIWRVEFGYDGQPIIQRLDAVSHAQAEHLFRSPFTEWINR